MFRKLKKIVALFAKRADESEDLQKDMRQNIPFLRHSS